MNWWKWGNYGENSTIKIRRKQDVRKFNKIVLAFKGGIKYN